MMAKSALKKVIEPGHSISYKIACGASEDRSACVSAQADQSLCCLPKGFGFLANLRVPCKYCSDCTDVQADLSLCWMHMQSCGNYLHRLNYSMIKEK